MELDDGTVVRLHTNQPKKNVELVAELKRQIEHLDRLDLLNFKDLKKIKQAEFDKET